ncbi:putative disease resistance protein RGA1 [Sesamum alatum]|uniref:Disease resistance protein RGA1 n=1 Tax=Sesamum alatum TaxID=300844 RepID=A0AAE2CLI0_9LAMI|nr:putative disease resistance protein RGA1 [Sesamum alatum]
MADGLVSAVVETVLGILSSAALQEIGAIWGLKNELDSLESILRTVQLVLQDAETKQRKSQALQNWLWKLRHAAYDAENVLDRVATEGLRQRADSGRGMQHRLNSFFSLRNPLLFRLEMVQEVRKIRGKLDAVAEERLKFNLGEGVVENRFGETLESRQTSSLVNELEIYGRDEEKEMIVEKMLDRMRDELSVYAIWGMGGLGKTTLAQMIYNDERMVRCFELRLWVCVSDDFSIQRLVKAIIESIDGGVCNISELDPLQCRLQEGLRGKRFLLVLDDVWNENHVMWDRLRDVLRCGSMGSMVMVTTRIEKVALMMATIGVHQIGCLSEEDSWSLFKQRAFTTGDGEENFVAIGKAIVKKCGGVPLAIKALGSLMRFKFHESEWLAVKESEIWHLSDDENGILPALRLSYDNLVPQMRQCFAYCCLFPKDHVMEENQLIQLWMANGFVPSEGQTDLQHTGRFIFKELVWRSFLQEVEKNSRGYMTCKMHDLMHDLAASIMRHEAYILEHEKVMMMNTPKTLLHLSFGSGPFKAAANNKNKPKFPTVGSLRSLITHYDNIPAEDLSSIISKQQYLRALDVRPHGNREILLNLACRLEHLRYLAMSCTNIKRLPESLTRLLNLQTLKLTNSAGLLELPKGLKVMKNLWFLEIKSFHSLLCTPPRLGELTCLRELSIFIVGQDMSHQIAQLKELNLGGKLSIQRLENVSNIEEAKSAKLIMKNDLTSLRLSWTKGIKKNSKEYYEEVLEGLQPHHSLEAICIKSYQGSRFPNWMSTVALKNLKKITLGNCRRCEHLPPLGKLPYLTNLTLRTMNSVECLDTELYDNGERPFPALTTLTISDMRNLEEWSTTNSVESFPCLKDLEIRKCPKLCDLPCSPTLRHLDISGSSATLLGSLAFLTSLTSLYLSDFGELVVFPPGLLQNHTALERLDISFLTITTLSNVLDNLSALKKLYLRNCSHLESLPPGLKNLKSLEILVVHRCNGLRSFPADILEGLSSLRVLSIEDCKKLKPLSGPPRRATAPQVLRLFVLPELEHLPESLQRLTSLRELEINNCEGLFSLPHWMGSLESLSVLKILYCKNLKSLPDGIKNLKSLRKLEIGECPELEKRCKKPKGVDWPKISHIPNIIITWNAVQWLDE